MRILGLICFAALLAACTSTQHGVPEAATVLLDGPYATVTRFELEPGQAQARHEGPARVIYSLTDYTIEWSDGDAAPKEMSWSAGDVHWHLAGPHAARNVSDDAARYVVFARTARPLPAAEGVAEPEVSAGGHGKLLFENEAVRVVAVTLAPGEAAPRHQGGYRAIYSLGDYDIRWTEGEAAPEDVHWTAGKAHWHGPAMHRVENIGTTPARYLVVTFNS